tara:strand:- start:148 stop:477 length:330 start_codon:yes stop_codon:yes gene_type:complete
MTRVRGRPKGPNYNFHPHIYKPTEERASISPMGRGHWYARVQFGPHSSGGRGSFSTLKAAAKILEKDLGPLIWVTSKQKLAKGALPLYKGYFRPPKRLENNPQFTTESL